MAVISILVSLVSMQGLGISNLSIMKLFFTSMLVFIASLNRVTRIISVIMLLISSSYFPTGLTYGYVNIGYVSSFFETTYLEALEFISIIKTKNILITLLFISMVISILLIGNKTKNIKLIIALPICAVAFPNSYYYKFLKDSYKITTEYISKKESLMTQKGMSLSVSEPLDNKKNTIIIVGESVRKDFMHVYGFKYNNTPFLDSVKGYFFDGYYSTSPNTSPSLQRTLSLYRDNNTSERDNVISIANASGIKTYWLSNQGFSGKFDTPVSRIAMNAKNKFFLKEGDFKSKNIDDFELINQLEKIINNTNGGKVIFMHMVGSHPKTCDRLNGFPVYETSNNDNINCYISTIAKLDSFIKKIKSVMDSTNDDYSIVYFSDHGMKISDGEIIVGNEYLQNFEIPLIIINRNDEDHVVVNKKISAYDFISIFSMIIGVDVSAIENYRDIDSIPENNHISVYDWENMISIDTLSSQPASSIIK